MHIITSFILKLNEHLQRQGSIASNEAPVRRLGMKHNWFTITGRYSFTLGTLSRPSAVLHLWMVVSASVSQDARSLMSQWNCLHFSMHLWKNLQTDKKDEKENSQEIHKCQTYMIKVNLLEGYFKRRQRKQAPFNSVVLLKGRRNSSPTHLLLWFISAVNKNIQVDKPPWDTSYCFFFIEGTL